MVTILRRTFADVGWAAPRVLDALDDAPLYFDAVGQARLPSWSSGRVALLGDAAYCSSPVSGMSTSLALTGAYVLAGELAAHPRPRRRSPATRRSCGPTSTRPRSSRRARPASPTRAPAPGVAVMNTVLRVAASPAGRSVGRPGRSKLFTPARRRADLPTYPVARPGDRRALSA